MSDQADCTALTVREFCARNRISKPTYYKLRQQGRGPREMCLGFAIRITVDAERDWQRERENPTGDEAAERERQQRRRRERSVAAASGHTA